jgi:hypothetical protein
MMMMMMMIIIIGMRNTSLKSFMSYVGFRLADNNLV